MNNLGIVIEREYLTRVKKKSFILLTIIMPFLMVALVGAPVALGMIKSDEVTDVYVIDQTGRYAPVIFAAQKVDSTKSEGYRFIPATKSITDYRKLSVSEDNDDDIIVLNITDDLSKDPKAAKLYSNGELQVDLIEYIDDVLDKQIRRDKIAAYDIPQLDNVVEDLQRDFSVGTVKWTAAGETDSSTDIAIALGMIAAILIYMFVLCYGAMVMQGVMEEKTSRIIEILVGSVKPFDLMMGKIIGVMLVGFTQIIIWGVMLSVLSAVAGIAFIPELMSANLTTDAVTAQQTIQNSPAQDMMAIIGNLPLTEVAILFVMYFLGGYILYSSFYAAIGAAINSQEDSSQFMMPMVIVMIFALYAAMGSITNTDGPLAFWASLFPLTSPVVMMVRIPFDVPLWQEVLSVMLLYVTALLFVWLAGKIYRVGILSYGKKPTVKELWKWIRFSE